MTYHLSLLHLRLNLLNSNRYIFKQVSISFFSDPDIVLDTYSHLFFLNVYARLYRKQHTFFYYIHIVAHVMYHKPEEVSNAMIKIFLEGRDAWTYSWQLLEQKTKNSLNRVTVGVEVKLKKEFHSYSLRTQYRFLCKLQLKPDSYSPKISIQ